MPSDIEFNPVTREIVFLEDGDFATVSNPSTQNGMILLEARCMNILQPSFGIGYNSQILGSSKSEAAFQLNRWNSQVSADSGRSKWRPLNNPPNIQFSFEADVDYLANQ